VRRLAVPFPSFRLRARSLIEIQIAIIAECDQQLQIN